jgi:hypothetical protein
VGVVIFDSHAPIGTGQGVYMSAVAEQIVDEHEIARGVDVFSRRSLMHGGAVWTIDDLQNEAGLRLYRAVADAHWILAKDGRPDHRIATGPT